MRTGTSNIDEAQLGYPIANIRGLIEFHQRVDQKAASRQHQGPTPQPASAHAGTDDTCSSTSRPATRTFESPTNNQIYTGAAAAAGTQRGNQVRGCSGGPRWFEFVAGVSVSSEAVVCNQGSGFVVEQARHAKKQETAARQAVALLHAGFGDGYRVPQRYE